MNCSDFLIQLKSFGIHLKASNGQLHVDAPAGTLTPELKQELIEQKWQLLRHFKKLRQATAQALLDKLFDEGLRIKVEEGRLIIGPADLARKYADQIREYKSELLLLGAYCPECLAPLKVTQTADVIFRECPSGHYDDAKHFSPITVNEPTTRQIERAA